MWSAQWTIALVFDRFTKTVEWASGRPLTFVCTIVVILIWAVTGPIFHFSDTWQLIINTATTIVTFEMGFLIQANTSRGFAALHAKLDELIRSSNARNALIGLEDLSSEEIQQVREQIQRTRTTT